LQANGNLQLRGKSANLSEGLVREDTTMKAFDEFELRRSATILALLLVPTALASQNPQPPQIKVSTRLVELGVIVRNKDGPVEDMTEDDFVVLDRGKPQKISVFTLESAASPASVPQLAKMLPPNTFSDLPQYGAARPRSVTIVLLDNLNTLYGSSPQSQYEVTPRFVEDLALQNAKTHLIKFIEQLQPEDRVAIYGLRHSLHVLCDFTGDRDQLLTILKNYDTKSITNRAVVEPGETIMVFPGHDKPFEDISPQASGFENGAATRLAGAANADRGAETMAALQQIAAHVANIPGRKNLVWLTANLPFSGAAMARVLGPANIAVYPVDARGLLGASPAVNADISGSADADDVSGASGHWDNMPAQVSQPIGIAMMQEVANETGGQAFVNTNDLTNAIRKAVEDSAVTYTLGFYIDASALDGKFHEIKVQSKRKDVTIRYPKGYFAYHETGGDQDQNLKTLLTTVQSPIESSLIPLQATLKRVNEPEANSLSVSCSIDVHSLRWTQTDNLRKGAVAVYVIEQDPAGKVLQQWEKKFDVQFTDGQYSALLQSGMMFHQIVHLHAGVTTLRVMVQEPITGQIGSLIIPLAQVN
jgi:VWFA-related protein